MSMLTDEDEKAIEALVEGLKGDVRYQLTMTHLGTRLSEREELRLVRAVVKVVRDELTEALGVED